MDKNKIKNIGICIVGLILIGIGFLGFFNQEEKDFSYDSRLMFVKSNSDDENKSVSSNEEVIDCSKIEDMNNRSLCDVNNMFDASINMALLKNNVEECDVLIKENRHICYDGFYFGKHNLSNNYCEKISDEKLKEFCFKN